MAGVTLIDVTKVYPGGVKAVDRVRFEVADRELVVLVGPSGCGKSTTLRMIAGLEEISSGTIEIGDRVVNEVSPKDRDIAMVFQNYALYPHMTVYKNMAFSLNLRRRELGLTKAGIDRKVREAAALLGLDALLGRKPKALSGGQRQRAAVGRAIVRDPKVFLFDEPLSNLDAKLRVETRSEIKRLQRRLEATTIYVTHDQEEAMTLGHRIVVMESGVVQQFASPQEVYERPANRFVASFVGTPPMSFWEGRVVRRGDRLAFQDGGELLSFPKCHRDRLSGYVDRAMVLGIRPDAFSIDPSPVDSDGGEAMNGGKVRLGVRVTLVEPLGDRKDVYMTTGTGKQLVGRIAARESVSEGRDVSVWMDMSSVHVFEPGASGVNVTAAQPDEAMASAG